MITMIRRLEFPAAWSSLKTVDCQLAPDTIHFLLLNDERDTELEAALGQRPNTRVITPGKNLGVAVGRNLLIAAALEWGADIIFSLDNDLLVPTDYLGRVTEWIASRRATGEKIGIVAPAVLDFHAAAERIMTAQATIDAEQGRLEDFPDTDTLRVELSQAWPEGVPVEAVYHAGIRNWRHHYMESFRARPTQVRSLFRNSRGLTEQKPGLTELRLDPATRDIILHGGDDGLPIDTAPGGACAYTAELLAEIGGIDEAFSPFGYEDSDFAIRSVQAGFSNYSLPSNILLHDLDSRQKTRSPAALLHSQGRARGLIGRKHLPPSERSRALTELACLAPLQAVDLVGASAGQFPSVAGGIIGSIVAYFAGFAEGLFTEPREAALGGDPRPSGYLSVPETFKHQASYRYRPWAGSPPSGLPESFLVETDVAWSWHPEEGRLELTRLKADAPGMFRIDVQAEILDVGLRDKGGNADPLSCRLSGAQFSVEDWGFLRSLQTTAAWFRSEVSTGYLEPMIRSPRTRFARDAAWFLSLRDRPGRVDVSVEPPTPISVGQLLTGQDGFKLRRSIGLSTMVREITYY